MYKSSSTKKEVKHLLNKHRTKIYKKQKNKQLRQRPRQLREYFINQICLALASILFNVDAFVGRESSFIISFPACSMVILPVMIDNTETLDPFANFLSTGFRNKSSSNLHTFCVSLEDII